MEKYNKIEIQKFSTSATEMRYLLSHNKQYYEVNYPIVELLTVLQEHSTEEEATSSYISKKRREIHLRTSFLCNYKLHKTYLFLLQYAKETKFYM